MRAKTCWREFHALDAPAIDARALSVRKNGRIILEEVSFKLDRSESLAVVGPNGAGKTTLLSVIAGLDRPTSGEIRIFGHLPGRHLCLGYLPQRAEVEWNFPATVLDVVVMGRVGRAGLFRSLGQEDRKKAEEALQQVGLSHLKERRIRELSGGERQRMLIARALAQEAQILLLDEPLAGLDAPAQEGLLALLAALAPRGLAILVAMHELDLVSRYFQRVLLLRTRPIALGDPKAVLTPETLRVAYGTALHLLPSASGVLAVGDTCCPKEDPSLR
ncbi:MAG: ABC transporter ATP-binding protein [Candidatus Bipolaricaulota bacterium]|nr:ABC transporter ATP-binding protein [Candidatus Bipolaricaulota bacterium]MDW8126847.1 ABC transporter ATP-binding protein [Candidatus Bipolaricaulota bacterium]